MSTETVPARRACFAAGACDALARQVASDFARLPERGGWTNRAVWYERTGELLAVVGDHEESATDLVLAHALFHAGDRAVTLVLPNNWAYPTRFRQPWLTKAIDVWSHAGGVVAFAPPLTREATREAVVGHPTQKPHRLPPAAAEWVRRLTEWAAADPGLADAHTSSLRGWSHEGQRVLTIGGKRTIEVKAGVDAKTDKALRVKVTGPLASSEFDDITARVERGMADAKAKTYGRFEEHHLQVQLRQYPGTLRLEHPLLREVPAWRPAGGGARRARARICRSRRPRFSRFTSRPVQEVRLGWELTCCGGTDTGDLEFGEPCACSSAFRVATRPVAGPGFAARGWNDERRTSSRAGDVDSRHPGPNGGSGQGATVTRRRRRLSDRGV